MALTDNNQVFVDGLTTHYPGAPSRESRIRLDVAVDHGTSVTSTNGAKINGWPKLLDPRAPFGWRSVG